MRECTKCGAEKPLDDFYAHPMGPKGRQSACKECVKAGVRANRQRRIDYYREYDRTRAKEPHRVEARTEYAKTNPLGPRPEKDPVKRAARVAVGNAVRDGRIPRPPACEICQAHCDTHAHHDDYTRPLDVIWVCTACHALIHAYWRAQERRAA
jgi:hypothetical protein